MGDTFCINIGFLGLRFPLTIPGRFHVNKKIIFRCFGVFSLFNMEQSPVVQKQTTLDTDHKKVCFFVGVFVTKILYTVSIDIIYCVIKLYMITRTFRSITIYIILLTYPARGAACQGFFFIQQGDLPGLKW